MVYIIGIITAMRPTALATIFIGQFQKSRLKDDVVWKIKSAVGSTNGSSKTSRGGFNAIGQKPLEVCVWNEHYLDGAVNFFQDLDDY